MLGITDFGAFLKKMRVYLLGRGIVSSAVILATFALPALGLQLTFVPALIIAAGGTLLNTAMRLYDQREYEEGMVNLYREDIASHLGKAPEDVTRADLSSAAEHNDVIAQALKRQRHKNIVAIATSALAGLTTFGLLYVGLAQHAVSRFFIEQFGSETGNILRYASSGIVSSISGLIVHDGLEAAIGAGAGLTKAAAHDRIVALEHEIERGRSVTPEQVYSVIVASDPQVAEAIQNTFNESYNRMPPARQKEAMTRMNAAPDMQVLANAINEGRIRPGHLAYIAGDTCTTPHSLTPHIGQPAVPYVEPALAPAERASEGFVARLNAERSAQQAAALQR